jgi:prolipoprotein diacylglyceryl transferase
MTPAGPASGHRSQMQLLASIPSPSISGFHIGPLYLHFYGLCYVVAITLCIFLFRRLWAERGGDPDVAYTIALWAVPAGIIGARLYHDVTSWNTVQHNWYGWAAVWDGGLGIWGGIAGGFLGALVPIRRLRLNLVDVMDAAAPGLLVAQAIGRVGNYFNQELFGGPTNLPWALQISPAHRPPGYAGYATFHPTFLYELIWDLLLAGALVWLYRRRLVRPPGIFALYVTGYSAFRIFEEKLRIDPAHYILGQRVNFWVAILLTLAGAIWFVVSQRRGRPEVPNREPPEPQRRPRRSQPVDGRAASKGRVRVD